MLKNPLQSEIFLKNEMRHFTNFLKNEMRYFANFMKNEPIRARRRAAAGSRQSAAASANLMPTGKRKPDTNRQT
ncbi:hypothetical protein [Methanimicrococcus stummii]|uniref:hypothetical protein n=1 Tax=Methanimicrococcus stummii TaxID=3028294 RepID=UPI002930746E|nr:hypothetical protein [Methanimicrococcus sp. Es2]